MDEATFIIGLFPIIAGVILSIIRAYFSRRQDLESEEKITQAETRVQQEPEKSQPAWDLARLTLNKYYERNLRQVRDIFWLTVFVMFLGFLMILAGVSQAIFIPSRDNTFPAILATTAGLITEFIGATFFFVYRSTMQQASIYTDKLERINAVGVAMQILDTIPDEATENNLKHSTKAHVVKTLMEQKQLIPEVAKANE